LPRPSEGGCAVLSGILFFLALLARPDAALFVAVTGAFLLWRARSRDSWSELAGFVVAFSVPFLFYWLGRWAYFGDLMPNTFHAKSTPSVFQALQGFFYLTGFGSVAFLFAGILIWRSLFRRLRVRPETTLLFAQFWVWTAYVIYVGGDFMPLSRFMVPILPALAVLLQDSVWITYSTARRRKTGLLAASAIAVVVTFYWGTSTQVVNRFETYVETRQELQALGLWFRENTAPDDVIAVSAAGAVPYYSQRPAIDMYGLSDRHIARHGHVENTAAPAHKRYDAEYVLDRRPDFIVINNIRESSGPFLSQEQMQQEKRSYLVANTALFEQPRFWSDYTRVVLVGLEDHTVVFLRNDRLQEFLDRGTVQMSSAASSSDLFLP
jgi:arabinofuranosyltransferase